MLKIKLESGGVVSDLRNGIIVCNITLQTVDTFLQLASIILGNLRQMDTNENKNQTVQYIRKSTAALQLQNLDLKGPCVTSLLCDSKYVLLP